MLHKSSFNHIIDTVKTQHKTVRTNQSIHRGSYLGGSTEHRWIHWHDGAQISDTIAHVLNFTIQYINTLILMILLFIFKNNDFFKQNQPKKLASYCFGYILLQLRGDSVTTASLPYCDFSSSAFHMIFIHLHPLDEAKNSKNNDHITTNLDFQRWKLESESRWMSNHFF